MLGIVGVQLFTGALARNGEKWREENLTWTHTPCGYGVPAFRRLFSAYVNCTEVETSKFLFCRQRELEAEGGGGQLSHQHQIIINTWSWNAFIIMPNMRIYCGAYA